MKLIDLVAHTMQLVTLNRDVVSSLKVKDGVNSVYVTDSKWSDIFCNVLDRLYDGFNELVSANKMPYKTIDVTKLKDDNIINLDVTDLSRVIAVFVIDKNGRIKNYAFRNLSQTSIVVRDCRETELKICYDIAVPLFTMSDLSATTEIDLKDYGINDVLANWVAKYACAEIQEHIDTYKAYSNKQEVISEINRLPANQTIPTQDSVEDVYGL